MYHDLLGMMQHPHHAKVTPKFCKQYAAVGAAIQSALQQYREEVRMPTHLICCRLPQLSLSGLSAPRSVPSRTRPQPSAIAVAAVLPSCGQLVDSCASAGVGWGVPGARALAVQDSR